MNWATGVCSAEILRRSHRFYNHYHDLFNEEITGRLSSKTIRRRRISCFRRSSATVFSGYTKGVEIAPEWRPTSFWRLRGSYSFLHMNLGKAPNSGDVGTAPGIVGSSPAA